MVTLGTSDLDIFPLVLGGNVFGWTADRDTSFEVLDAFVAGGGTMVDTADVYSAWAPGNTGGESETIIGEWLRSSRVADVVIATKVSKHPDFPGLSAANVRRAAEASLRRLGTEQIDLYYAHADDPETPLTESVAAFGSLVSDGLVRYTALSNFSGARTREWIRVADDLGVPRPVAIQPHYNLVHRVDTERDLVPVAEEFDLAVLPYYALASGFLTGKYRSTDASAVSSARAGAAASYATDAGIAVIDAVAEIAADHDASITSTALAWLRQQPTVAAPIASARTTAQVPDLLASAALTLTADELTTLDTVSR